MKILVDATLAHTLLESADLKETPEILELKDLVKQATAKFILVKLDQTKHWHIEGDFKAWGVYLFNGNEVTQCCEITPSYYLHHLYNSCDSEDPKIREEVENYQTPDDQNVYVHCHALDNLPAIQSHVCSAVTQEDIADSYDLLIEDYLEHYRCNHYL